LAKMFAMRTTAPPKRSQKKRKSDIERIKTTLSLAAVLGSAHHKSRSNL